MHSRHPIFSAFPIFTTSIVYAVVFSFKPFTPKVSEDMLMWWTYHHANQHLAIFCVRLCPCHKDYKRHYIPTCALYEYSTSCDNPSVNLDLICGIRSIIGIGLPMHVVVYYFHLKVHCHHLFLIALHYHMYILHETSLTHLSQSALLQWHSCPQDLHLLFTTNGIASPYLRVVLLTFLALPLLDSFWDHSCVFYALEDYCFLPPFAPRTWSTFVFVDIWGLRFTFFTVSPHFANAFTFAIIAGPNRRRQHRLLYLLPNQALESSVTSFISIFL